MSSVELSITRIIKAPPSMVFEAWTEPEQLKKWWGPAHITCSEAHVDLRVGGEYRIANQKDDGEIIWIFGKFEEIIPPEKLVYDWSVGTVDAVPSLVTILFNKHEAGTELVIRHEKIADEPLRDMHQMGWLGCMDKLESLFTH